MVYIRFKLQYLINIELVGGEKCTRSQNILARHVKVIAEQGNKALSCLVSPLPSAVSRSLPVFVRGRERARGGKGREGGRRGERERESVCLAQHAAGREHGGREESGEPALLIRLMKDLSSESSCLPLSASKFPTCLVPPLDAWVERKLEGKTEGNEQT